MAEAKAINSSLSALGNVIASLADPRGVAHVPFRDSKLTRILAETLSGRGRAALLATVGPAHRHAGESLSTLLFAARCMRVTEASARRAATDRRHVAALAAAADTTSLHARLAHSEANHARQLNEQRQQYEALIDSIVSQPGGAAPRLLAAAAPPPPRPPPPAFKASVAAAVGGGAVAAESTVLLASMYALLCEASDATARKRAESAAAAALEAGGDTSDDVSDGSALAGTPPPPPMLYQPTQHPSLPNFESASEMLAYGQSLVDAVVDNSGALRPMLDAKVRVCFVLFCLASPARAWFPHRAV